jgi:serine/threonine protein kinase
LKPDNILLKGGNIKLADFGWAKFLNEGIQTPNAQAPVYRAPESSSGNYNFALDTWSVGVILFEMIQGARPYQQI